MSSERQSGLSPVSPLTSRHFVPKEEFSSCQATHLSSWLSGAAPGDSEYAAELAVGATAPRSGLRGPSSISAVPAPTTSARSTLLEERSLTEDATGPKINIGVPAGWR